MFLNCILLLNHTNKIIVIAIGSSTWLIESPLQSNNREWFWIGWI
jgi:hypothetical protein